MLALWGKPNIAENQRNRKHSKRGRPRHFDAVAYKRRFTSERTFAWIDKFGALLGGHYLAYALINLRHLLARAE